MIDYSKIKSTKEVEVPIKLSDQIIGQDLALELIKKAAKQRRNVLLIGSPGTGKSLLGQALAELLPKEKLVDIIAFPNQTDENTPLIRTTQKGKGKELTSKAKLKAQATFKNQSLIILTLIIFTSILPYYFWKIGEISDVIYASSMITGMIFIVGVIIFLNINKKTKMIQTQIPKLLIDNSERKTAPFIDACLLPGQWVFTNPRPSPIGLTQNKVVYNAQGKKQKVTKVKEIDYKGKIYYIKPRLLYPFTASPNHYFLVLERVVTKQFKNREFQRLIKKQPSYKWKKAKDLKKGDMLIYPKLNSPKEYLKLKFNNILKKKGYNKKIIPLIICDERCAEIFGWYLAEGYTRIRNRGGTIGFALGKHELKEAKILSKLLEDKFKLKAHFSYRDHAIELFIYSKTLGEWFEQQFGKGAKSKRIPPCIFQSPENVKIAFLRAYIKGDGYETKDTLSVATTSKSLSQDLLFLFSSIGIIPTCHERSLQGSIIRGTHLYEFYIHGKQLKKFGKKGNFQHYFSHKNLNFVPIKEIRTKNYEGKIINMETQDGTYLMPCITHNSGAHAGALLGDVLHDPLQTFFPDTIVAKIMPNKSNNLIQIQQTTLNKLLDPLFEKNKNKLIKKGKYEAFFTDKNELIVLGEKNNNIEDVEVLSTNRYFYNNNLIKITTESGKELLVTPEHKVAIKRFGKIIYKEAQTLTRLDKVITID